MTRPNPRDVEWVMRRMARAMTGLDLPAVEKIAEEAREDAFRVLIATVLSARTQDATTAAASARLFRKAPTARRVAALSVPAIARLIYPVSFYRTKARHVQAACEALLQRFGGRVPGTMEELLTLPGVGRKTANLVVSLGYGKPGMCVDTHVHRISNRLGYVSTKTPEETEFVLRAKLPRPYWTDYNTLMVTFGRQVCRPVSPLCSRCPVFRFCDRKNVVRSR